MNETTAKPKAKATATPIIPLFELPKFELPKMEVPAAFREVAEKGVAQAKEHYEKMKSAAEDATDDALERLNAVTELKTAWHPVGA